MLILLLHIAAGGLGLVLGAVALYATKGARLHRKSGTLFHYAMVTMSISGAVVAFLRGVEANAIPALLAAYLVFTGLATVRPPSAAARLLDRGAMLVALALGLTSFALGLETLASGHGARDGIPVPMLFMFGTVALLAGVSDLRMIRSGGIRGTARLSRHLWRMCFALWIASASFFLGQADEFPDALRITPLLALLAFLPLLVMFYWLRRIRVRRNDRGIHEATLEGHELQ